jgi:hypothetical protein
MVSILKIVFVLFIIALYIEFVKLTQGDRGEYL